MSRKRDSVSSTSETSPVMAVFGTIGDTTWRMFVPIVGLLLIGDAIDRASGTRPWLMLVGATLGSLIAALLIRKQLRK